MWDADQYERFRGERSRPFFDLLSRIPDRSYRTIVEDGQSSGDFSIEDAAAGAACVKTTMVCFMHPTMMALSAEHARPEIEQVIAYALRGLGARPRR